MDQQMDKPFDLLLGRRTYEIFAAYWPHQKHPPAASLNNAKKYVEMGHFGGKNTETHAATVVGDTVGDPWKDTAGPSLHILIKLLNTISLVFIPLFLSAIIIFH